MASLIGGVENLIVEHGEVERETEPDWMRGGKVRNGNFAGRLVSLQGLVRRFFALVSKGKLGEVAVIVALPRKILALISTI